MNTTWFRRRAAQVTAVILPAALLTVAPSAATAADAGELRVETYVLPLGAPKPSLEELQNGDGTARLRQLAAAEPAAQLALETVGPASSYASLSTQASGAPSVSERARSSAAAGPRATAPEPARKMSLDECAKGLGTDKKFFVKSRFAVCNGASFVQTWFRNSRPVGESMFNVRVIGTVARNSRTINYAYHFSDFLKTGSNAADGLSITTKGNTPQSWPSGARYIRGGDLPAGARTFAQLRAQSTFKQTVLAKPGQGTGSADLVFAVYEPSVKYTAPAPWTLNGNGGNLFMLAPRWDAASYLANSTGGGNPDRKGAATFSYITPLTLSAKPGAEERAEAQHIRQAFLVPQDTKPYMSAKKVPGQTAKEPLHRTVSEARNKKNRAAAVKQCKRYWGPNYTNGGKECDEYPFASTYEGAAEVEYDPEAKKFNFSAKPIPGDDNQAGGLILKSYYAKNRIIDGLNDGFIVKIVT
ncbi:NucA/NucB deoxyribonuclease domain-containing protein [Streptomyces nigra]|uniref:NucA/NucB deoxyribonuclease domain-containing protein n=1 Tax=Streptomyces nigra TaxID=1827580 RepID=UPI00382C8048